MRFFFESILQEKEMREEKLFFLGFFFVHALIGSFKELHGALDTFSIGGEAHTDTQ